MTASQRRRRDGGTDRGALLFAAALLPALFATAVVIISDDQAWLRFGALIAVWSAVSALAAALRYRELSRAHERAQESLRERYELELEAEVAARREYELSVESEIREDIERTTAEEMRALHLQLRRLRESIVVAGYRPMPRAGVPQARRLPCDPTAVTAPMPAVATAIAARRATRRSFPHGISGDLPDEHARDVAEPAEPGEPAEPAEREGAHSHGRSVAELLAGQPHAGRPRHSR